MTYTSSVRRITGDNFLIMRASYLILCKGNTTAAALISYFEGWHNYKKDIVREWITGGRQGKEPNLWQHHTIKDIEKGLMGIGKRHSIDIAKKQLTEMGIITIGRNPDYKMAFDATHHYMFSPDVVNNLLSFVENSKPGQDVEIDIPEFVENDTSESAENSAAIPKNLSNKSTKKVSGRAPGDKKTPVKKQDKEEKPPRAYWQPFVDTWHEFYVAHVKGEAPSILGRRLTELGQLYDLLQLRAKKKLKEWTEAQVVESLTFFLTLAWSEDWLQKHFLLKNLIEQFDAVYAREVARMELENKNKPKTFKADLAYIVERYKEGLLDERLLTPDIYKLLEEQKLVPIGYREKFTAATPELQKAEAIKGWLKAQNPS